MQLQERLERDLKSALLSGDKKRIDTLRGIKNALQYEAVALKVPKENLSQEQVQQVMLREAKKVREAANMYQEAGEDGRAEAELAELHIIDEYLPAKLREEEVLAAVEQEIAKIENPTIKDMGRVVGSVRARLGAQADGAVIARLVRHVLESQ